MSNSTVGRKLKLKFDPTSSPPLRSDLPANELVLRHKISTGSIGGPGQKELLNTKIWNSWLYTNATNDGCRAQLSPLIKWLKYARHPSTGSPTGSCFHSAVSNVGSSLALAAATHISSSTNQVREPFTLIFASQNVPQYDAHFHSPNYSTSSTERFIVITGKNSSFLAGVQCV